MDLKNKNYFTQETEDAIVSYNTETCVKVKSNIYKNKISKSFNKLAENVINRFKFPYFKEVEENLQFDVVSFLVLNINKYDQNKGKAFSYFSILAKNYLILGNNEQYKYKKIQQRIDQINPDHTVDIVDEAQERLANDDIPEFVRLMIEYWENNLSKVFTKRQEIMIADAVLNLFRMSQNIENYNKKALYLLIREMTGLRTQYITAVVNKMKEHNEILLNKYNTVGIFDVDECLDDFL